MNNPSLVLYGHPTESDIMFMLSFLRRLIALPPQLDLLRNPPHISKRAHTFSIPRSIVSFSSLFSPSLERSYFEHFINRARTIHSCMKATQSLHRYATTTTNRIDCFGVHLIHMFSDHLHNRGYTWRVSCLPRVHAKSNTVQSTYASTFGGSSFLPSV
uniref:Uncharacterized protein n=1 Tax=Cynodon dactylon x Cynodon transvaalensis TaxID=1920021 RepID=A0A5J6YDD9_9POAL|nr:hypothetical protein [Cynodon dactylon x Cynodon transvaalensis]